MVWGDFWKKTIRTPSQVLSVGNAQVALKLDQVNVKGAGKKIKKILVFYENEMKSFIQRFAELMETHPYEIHIKFHHRQNEWVPINTIHREFDAYQNVFFEEKINIYDAFEDTDIVVGGGSTALYEAVACGIPMYFTNNKIIDETYGRYIETPEQLCDLMVNHQDLSVSSDERDALFKLNWKASFKAYCDAYNVCKDKT